MTDVFRRSLFLAALTAALVAVSPLRAQSNAINLHTEAEIQQQAAALKAKAAASPAGLGVAKLYDYGDHSLLLVVRVKTGDSEQHALWADETVILSGEATLVTGGTLTGPHPAAGNAAGETRGSGIDGGTEKTLHAGDIVHIAAGIPHWVKVAPGGSVTYLTFKVK
jgi:hypothetical protein